MMQIPLNLSAIDLYMHRESQGQFLFERRVLPSELSKEIKFSPSCDPLATRLCVLYKSAAGKAGQSAERRKEWSDYLIVHRDYQQDPHLRVIILCFFVVTEKIISPSFKFSHELVKSTTPFAFITESAVVQVKLIVDYQLLSRSLSQKPLWCEMDQFLDDKILREAYRELRRRYLSLRKAYQERDAICTLLPEGHKGLPKNYISLDIITKPFKTILEEDVNHRFDTYHFVRGMPKQPDIQLRPWSLEQTKLKAMAELKKKKESVPRSNPKIIATQASDASKAPVSPSRPPLPFQRSTDAKYKTQWPRGHTYTYSKEELKKQAEARAEDETKKVHADILTSLIKDVHQLRSHDPMVIVNTLTHFNSKEYFEIYKPVSYLLTRGLDIENIAKKKIKELEKQKLRKLLEDGKIEESFAFFSKILGSSELHITEQNARQILLAIKAFDRALQSNKNFFLKRTKLRNICHRISDLMRRYALQIGSSAITTCEAFTYSPYPEIYTNLDYLTNSKNWIDKRVAEQAKLIIDYNILAHSLSRRLKPLVVATRGNTGAGKSFWVRHFIQEYLKDNIQLEDGVLNPDLIKARLKKMTNKCLLNSQVYAEARVLFERFLETLTQQINNIMGTVIDTRLLTIEEFRQVLAFARLRGAHLEVIDVDAPIWNSIASVLNREPFCKDPCVPFEVIKDGFIRSRKYRAEFIEASRREGVNYSLYRANGSGQFTLVAENRHCQFTCIDGGFEDYLTMPLEEEMEAIGNAELTQELIDQLDLPIGKKQAFMQWRGYTVKEALQRHSEGKAL